DGRQTKLGGGRVGDIPLQIGEAVALAEQDLAILRHQGRAHELLARNIGLNNFFHARSSILRKAGARQYEYNCDATKHVSLPNLIKGHQRKSAVTKGYAVLFANG